MPQMPTFQVQGKEKHDVYLVCFSTRLPEEPSVSCTVKSIESHKKTQKNDTLLWVKYKIQYLLDQTLLKQTGEIKIIY